MKTKNISIAFFLVLIFTGTLKINGQQIDKNSKKISCGEWLIETPWKVGFGGSIIKDNNANFTSSIPLLEYTYYPARFSAEKDLKLQGLSMQLVFASTSLKPHGFGAIDVNFKYELLAVDKWLDSYALLGSGLTYRDNDHLTSTTLYDNNFQPTFNTALGANLWLTKVMAVNFEGQAKFAKDPYLQANIGLVFKINPVKEVPILKPKSQQAKDALQHIRGIINK